MPRGGKKRGRTMASLADKHDLYQRAVQAADFEVGFCDRVFKKEYARPAETMCEDFCGTALISCEWVRSRRGRIAFGIDLDPEPLEWGRENNVSMLKKEQQERVHLIQGDVLDPRPQKMDVIAANNFSYFIFKERELLVRYFKVARAGLKNEGLFVLDLMGGPRCQTEVADDPRKKGHFTYHWEHQKFDPITHDTICRIHFEFRDGSKLRNAFIYDWRLYTIPELRDALVEAGFSRTDVYWEGTDHETEEGNGVFTRREKANADESWIAYIVAVR